MRHVLVTGATGFVGAHLVHALVVRGDDVHVIVRSADKLSALSWKDSVTAHVIDIWDREAVRSLYTTVKPEEIYHLASSVMQWGNTAGIEELVKVNVLSTAIMMEALELIPETRFVYTSSYLEVGGKNEPVREDHIPEPQDYYGITKLTGTLGGIQFAKNKGYAIIIGRFFTIYGPKTPKGRLVEQLTTRSLAGEEITLTHPEISRDFVYVTDAVSCLLELAEVADRYKGEIFNIGSGRKTTFEELTKIVFTITKSKSKINWHPEKRTDYEKFPWQADMTKTFNKLVWRPTTSLEMGLLKTIEAYKF